MAVYRKCQGKSTAHYKWGCSGDRLEQMQSGNMGIKGTALSEWPANS